MTVDNASSNDIVVDYLRRMINDSDYTILGLGGSKLVKDQICRHPRVERLHIVDWLWR